MNKFVRKEAIMVILKDLQLRNVQVRVQRDGYYATDSHFDAGGGYGSQIKCPKGSYCLHGMKYDCPGGYYGIKSGEFNSTCSGLCEAGFYCPPSSISKRQYSCGNSSVYCPIGSSSPRFVTLGYYTSGTVTNDTIDQTGLHYLRLHRVSQSLCEPGYYCPSDGIRRLCPAGRYGSSSGLSHSNCDGSCESGYYCPEGSITSIQVKCGGFNYYCPAGSSIAYEVDIGYYSVGGLDEYTRTLQMKCEPGHWCRHGQRYLCDGGCYGDSFGLTSSTCSGGCEAGYYCINGSISSKQHLCGDPNRYCPSNSYQPVVVEVGYYSIGGNVSSRMSQAIAPMGSYAINGYKYLCLPGYYGSISGLSSPECSGRCVIAGYYCPEGSVSPIGHVCGNDTVYCPSGSIGPIPVAIGYYTADYSYETCPPGQYRNISRTLRREGYNSQQYLIISIPIDIPCIRYKCPAGRYGESLQLSSSICSGKCSNGYYCLEASVSSYSTPCGGPNFICPEGSSSPTKVPAKYYTNENTSIYLRYESYECPDGYYCPGDGYKYICPAGKYSNSYNSNSDSKISCYDCDRGYYCVTGSASPNQFSCGSADYYCPQGSASPKPVHSGFYCWYSGPNAFVDDLVDVDRQHCSVEIPCEPGYYCTGGKKYMCPPGTFGWRYGLNSSLCSGLCPRGYYCPSYLTPQLNAPVHTQWPGKSQLKATEYLCGGVEFYCPKGSYYPTAFSGGYYTTGGGSDNLTRYDQAICPKGTYCQNGISYACPKGKYGNSTGLTNPSCSGWCPSSYYCPEGTSSPIQCPPGYFSVGAAYECSLCPGDIGTDLPCQDSLTCCFTAS
eukprot:gene19898-25853_t